MLPTSVSERIDELARRAGLRGVPPAVVAAALVLVAVGVLAALWRWWPRADAAGVTLDTAGTERTASAVGSATVGSSEASAAAVWVHVVGAVRTPGVYRVAAGSRVADAVDAAGGLLGTAAAQALNLARVVADGEQIAVPTLDEWAKGGSGTGAGGGAQSPGGAPAAGGGGGPIDLNSADEAALDALPGIGPSTAQKIVADREANGPFGSVEDLGRVSGIGPKKLEQLAGLICVR